MGKDEKSALAHRASMSVKAQRRSQVGVVSKPTLNPAAYSQKSQATPQVSVYAAPPPSGIKLNSLQLQTLMQSRAEPKRSPEQRPNSARAAVQIPFSATARSRAVSNDFPISPAQQ